MRVLIISNIFPPDFIGGYELMAFDIARAFAANGHDVLVVSSPQMMAQKAELDSSYRIARVLHSVSDSIEPDWSDYFSYGACVNLKNLAVLNELLIEFDPESVYCLNMAGLGATGIVWFLIASGYKPVVHLADDIFRNISQGPPSQYDRFDAYFGMDGFADRVSWIAMSNTVLRQVSGTLAIDLPDAAILPGWVQLELASDPKSIVRPSGGPARFVFASRVAEHKGIHLVLHAARDLLDRGVTEFSVDVYGGGGAEWEQSARAQDVDRNVFFKGVVGKKALIAAYENYDALLFPTWEREAFGLVAAEAAVQGCIPVMTDSMGASEWFRDGIDCIKVRRDRNSLAAAMQKIIAMDDDEKRKTAAALISKSRQMFSFASWFPRMEEAAIDARRQTPLDAERQRRVFGAACGLTRLWRQ
jgi:glycosyltransferase involved in cell wall biosynthesis